MRVLVTGLRGTVGRALEPALHAAGHEVIGWDRSVAPATDLAACDAYVRQINPRGIIHLAVASNPTGVASEGRAVSVDWSMVLARYALELRLPFVFTSTVMVFTDDAPGPFETTSVPDAAEGYGGEKAEAERLIRQTYDDAVIARLGWQIGTAPGSNNMIDFLHRQMAEHGVVRASTNWTPACAHLADTAEALVWCLSAPVSTYMLEGNRAGHSFYEIASALGARHDGAFTVEPADEPARDQRMLDDRVPMKQLDESLAGLGATTA
ncbi:MAG: sugar nucleotide-binding protein [Planctomycetota bacterium]